jgi:catechol 2,3-dioxygenase-like lactoylglutathione lyase family enzyme
MAGFAKYPAGAVLRAENLERAKQFYTDVMGYNVDEQQVPGGFLIRAGQGAMIMIYERPGMPAPQNTTLGIPLPAEDFDGCVEYLRSKGVELEEYDIPEMDLKTVNGVAMYDGMKSAWFKDTEGNILNIATM